MAEIRDLEESSIDKAEAFLVKGPVGQRTIGELKDASSFFEGVPETEVSVQA